MRNIDLKKIYAKKALSQIPRLLGNMDRNHFSETYGCFHRDYWLDKTSDFPDAVRQFGVHALALVYKYDFPESKYKGNKKIKDWAIAAMLFWTKIQHRDGSFDEFYPFERGWVGPTAFTTFTIVESFKILREEMKEVDKKAIIAAIRKAAYFIAGGEFEEDHLANHHAMATLALWKCYDLLGDGYLKLEYEKAFETFLTYHNGKEGWSKEYDGIDPGYLSATISFLGKVYKDNKDERILEVLEKSVEMSSYFVYPNSFYAGSIGSRNTLHFYPDGFEILSKENPLSARMADKMLVGLLDGKLVPPEIISDRYVFYRVPEFLESYLDHQDSDIDLARLPYEKNDIDIFFDKSKIYVKSNHEKYIVCNLAKGGVIKVFDKESNKLVVNDCGVVGKLKDGKIVTSQWIDEDFKIEYKNNYWSINGSLIIAPPNKLFTPFKNIIFRSIMLLLGWSPRLSHIIKGQIRKILILGSNKTNINFERMFNYVNGSIKIETKIKWSGGEEFDSLMIGDEFFIRYVPQSRYFQAQELDLLGKRFLSDELNKLNINKEIIYTKEI